MSRSGTHCLLERGTVISEHWNAAETKTRTGFGPQSLSRSCSTSRLLQPNDIAKLPLIPDFFLLLILCQNTIDWFQFFRLDTQKNNGPRLISSVISFKRCGRKKKQKKQKTNGCAEKPLTRNRTKPAKLLSEWLRGLLTTSSRPLGVTLLTSFKTCLYLVFGFCFFFFSRLRWVIHFILWTLVAITD